MEECDFAVIGGGSGGLAAAKEASRLGAKVICFDYVSPSTHGTKWGLGGTCVNVGCIPKILCHNAAKIGHSLHHSAEPFGWNITDAEFNWERLVKTVQMYIKQLNFGYRTGLKGAGVQYINAAASFLDANTLTYYLKGQQKFVKAKYILIAVGGRPFIPVDVPGALDYAITSDDLFSLKQSPGKTLVVGASYIALECAGFLNDLGYDVTVAVRSIVLRGFDRQCAEHLKTIMAEQGVKFRNDNVAKLDKVDVSPAPTGDSDMPMNALSQTSTGVGAVSIPVGGVRVTYESGEQEVFDTVLYAVGRRACTAELNCNAAGVEVHPLTGKILTNDEDRTTVPHIFAVGDAAFARPELTPVAIKAGELLARRLFTDSKKLMDYKFVPTVVFTPVEYGSCGLSEEEAIAQFGEEEIETFLFSFNPVPVSACHWKKVPEMCADEYDTDITPINLSKLVCLKTSMRILGYHCIALNAGETTQGYAVALKCGLTKHDFDETVGIHPTDAESFHSLAITRRSGESYVAAGGCGGGKCG